MKERKAKKVSKWIKKKKERKPVYVCIICVILMEAADWSEAIMTSSAVSVFQWESFQLKSETVYCFMFEFKC